MEAFVLFFANIVFSQSSKISSLAALTIVQRHLWRWQASLDLLTDEILATRLQEGHPLFYSLLDLWNDLRTTGEDLAKVTNAGSPDTGGTEY